MGSKRKLKNLIHVKKERVFKELLTVSIIEFDGWLIAIMNSGKFNNIFDISSIGSYWQRQLI